MNKTITLNNKKYELIKNYKEAFHEEEFLNRCTDYFYDYDYIVGDIAYGKLRLKGFYHPKNKKTTKINSYDTLEKYLSSNCAVDCKHFILRKEEDHE